MGGELCKKCNYVNENWIGNCARCGSDKKVSALEGWLWWILGIGGITAFIVSIVYLIEWLI